MHTKRPRPYDCSDWSGDCAANRTMRNSAYQAAPTSPAEKAAVILFVLALALLAFILGL